MLQESSSYQHIYQIHKKNKVSRAIIWVLCLLIACLFLPWTQNIRSVGKVTALRQENRTQKVNTIIGGRIAQWKVKEGDWVKLGDTLAILTEIKEDYLDPELIARTGLQLDAKSQSVTYYASKVDAQNNQLSALQNAVTIKSEQLRNKLQQQQLKITSDSAQVIAIRNEYQIASKQLTRQQELFEQGLVSLTQLEQRNQALQSAQAKLVSAENNLANSRQEKMNIMLELQAVQQDFAEKSNKIQGEKMQALSQVATGNAEVAKLQNQVSNYQTRSGFYFIVAPQSGQIIQAKKSGIGEIIKEGETLVEIVPEKIEQAVEIYVEPIDIPLVNEGQQVRFVFDGFPAIVFSGWPQASYGTFGGKVIAVESALHSNGKYRLLVMPDTTDKPWPAQLRLGTGAQCIALLKDVPVWYELWRNINGFPPDFYQVDDTDKSKKK